MTATASYPVHVDLDGVRTTGTLHTTRSTQTVMSEASSPDPNWEFADPNGHCHARSDDPDNPYPTLRTRKEHVECDGACGSGCEGYTATHWHCRICDVEVTPGTVPGPSWAVVLGPLDWRVEVDKYVPVGDWCVVQAWAEQADNLSFGVATVTNARMSSDGRGSAVLQGAGPLGRRRRAVERPEEQT